ncbi:plakophilin 4 [Cricetulus griseus]
MRRVSSVPSRAQSPSYVTSTGVSPSRGSLRTSLGSGFGSPSVTDSRPLNPSAYSSTTLPAQRAASPYSQRPASPTAVRRVGSVTSRQTSNPNGPAPQYQTTTRVGSPLTLTDAQTRVASPSQGQVGSSSPKRSGMTAVPQHLGPSLQRTVHDMDQFGQQQYDIYERMVPPRPDSLTGLRSSYASQHSQLGQELRSAVSPDLHITPIYEGRTYYSPVYRSPNHGTVELQGSQTALYRTGSEMYCASWSFLSEAISLPCREFAWRDPELPEVIHMLQHQFPSVQANAAAYLQHLCFGDNKVKMEVYKLGGIKHLVDLLDHRVLEVQKNACGALRNLVFGKSTDENKIAMKNVGGIPALLRLLRKSIDAEVRELVTGVLWNLSSCDAVKMTIIRDALSTLTNTVIVPHSGWNNSSFDDDHKIKFQTSLVLRNTTGCLRNLSSAGEEARKQMRSCEGLVDSLLYVIHTCVNTSDYDSKFAAYIRAAVRKEKGLPILVELLRMDNDRVVSSVATALRNMALDVRNKELIGKYAMRDLVNRLPGGNGPSILSDETVAAICCALHEVTSKNMENAKALADSGVGSTSSSPALLGIREPRSEYDRTQPPMQYYNSQGDTTHKGLYPGSSKPSPIYISSYSSPAREQNRRLQVNLQCHLYRRLVSSHTVRGPPQHQQLYYQDDSTRKTLDAYRLYLQSPRSYEDPYFDDRVHFPASTDYSTQYGLKSTTNYVDFYSTKRPSYRAEQYPGSPDSWV